MCALLLCAVAMLVAGAAHAQESGRQGHTNDTMWIKHQTWDFFGGRKSLGWSVDFIVRRQGPYEKFGLVNHRLRESFRPWLVYQINPTNRVSVAPLSYHYEAGLRATEALRDGSRRHELRSTIEWDSAAFPHDWVMVSARYRLEFRYLWPEGQDFRFMVRLRLRPRVRVSLNKRNFYDNGAIYAFTYNEVAVHYGAPEIVPLAFNQNRFFIGMGHRFERYLRIEAGLIHQWRSQGGGDQYYISTGPMVYFLIDYLSAFLKDQSRARRARRAEASDETILDLLPDPDQIIPRRDPEPTDDDAPSDETPDDDASDEDSPSPTEDDAPEDDAPEDDAPDDDE